uniref:Uncharacterized protein n=1 Tax=Rhizophora mucronata TaxID=61149 RepID=A0A2P2N3F6_RHIMU
MEIVHLMDQNKSTRTHTDQVYNNQNNHQIKYVYM